MHHIRTPPPPPCRIKNSTEATAKRNWRHHFPSFFEFDAKSETVVLRRVVCFDDEAGFRAGCWNQAQSFPVPLLRSRTFLFWATSRPVLHQLSQTSCKAVVSAALVSLKHRNMSGAFTDVHVSQDIACNNVPLKYGYRC